MHPEVKTEMPPAHSYKKKSAHIRYGTAGGVKKQRRKKRNALIKIRP
jgi:hypothetical protein